MVRIDQVPWHEMNVDGEWTLRVQDPFFRGIKHNLRRTLYQWRHFPGDMAVRPFLSTGKVIRNSGFGPQVQENRAVLDPVNSVVGHYYLDQLKTEEDLEKIRAPEHQEFELDYMRPFYERFGMVYSCWQATIGGPKRSRPIGGKPSK